jgi:hypothetical protein
MKKLLVLLMVLGACGAANAALSFSVNGQTAPDEITLAPSDEVVIDIMGDGLTLAQYDMQMSKEGVATLVLDNAVNLFNAGVFGETLGWVEGEEGTHAWFDLGRLPTGDPPVFPPMTGKLIDLMTLHCDGEGTVILTLFGDGPVGTETFDTLTIHQVIPEPMTLGLLGLGGLFLRRRK